MLPHLCGVVCNTGKYKCCGPERPLRRHPAVMPFRISTPRNCATKSIHQFSRRNSPSTTTENPISSCMRTMSRIAASSAWRRARWSIAPCVNCARASSSAGGRSRLPTWSARKTLLPWLCHRLAPAWTGRAAGWRLGYRTFMRVAAPACPGSGSTAIPAPRSNWARAFRGSRRRTRDPVIRCRSSTRRPWRRRSSPPCR